MGRVPAAIASAGGKYPYMVFSIPTDALLQNSLLNHLMCSQGGTDVSHGDVQSLPTVTVFGSISCTSIVGQNTSLLSNVSYFHSRSFLLLPTS